MNDDRNKKRGATRRLIILLVTVSLTTVFHQAYLLATQGSKDVFETPSSFIFPSEPSLPKTVGVSMSEDSSLLKQQKLEDSSLSSAEDLATVKARQLENDKNFPFTFSACLLVKDDNQLLPEWLAYHYTVMPLRRLIVGVDPLSLTRVEPILDKYRELGMDIDVSSAATILFFD